MDRPRKAKSQQASARNVIVEPPTDATPAVTRSRGDMRKVRMEEQWDADSLDALRGYAPLSRDATTAKELSWQHLKHENKQEVQDRRGTAASPWDSVEIIEEHDDYPDRRQINLGDMFFRGREDDTDSRTTTEDVTQRGFDSRDRFSHRDKLETNYGDRAQDARRHMNRGTERIVIEHTGRERSRSRSFSPNTILRRGPHPPPPPPPPRSPGTSEYSQARRPAYVEPDYSDEENIPSTSKSKTIRQQAKQRQSVPPRAAPADMALTRREQESSTLEEVLDELEALRLENERLRQGTSENPVPTQPAVLAYTSKVFYQVGPTLYLDEPRWEPAEGGGVVLLANNPIRKLEYYLDQHPEIAFAIYKEYKQTPPSDRSKIETKDGVYRSPTPAHEFLSLIATDMLDAIEELVQQIPGFGDYFPYFDPEGRILAPYLFMYYSAPFIPEVLPKLDVPSQNLIKQLQAAIDKSYGYEYDSAKLQAEKGMVARQHLKYLIRPGDVLVSNGSEGNIPQACIATGWIEAPEAVLDDSQYEESDYIRRKRVPRYGPLANSASSRKLTTYVWEVPVWYWLYDGTFAKRETRVEIVMALGYEEESIEIKNLNCYPLQYADEGMRPLLEKRGRTFWSLRNRRFVSYMRSEDDELYAIEDRYMVDTKAYKMLFPASKIAQMGLRHDLGAAAMARDEPPEEGNALLVAPPSIMAHNLQEKQWRELFVDRITDIAWNKQAFKDLVAEPETKELVQALVMKQLNAKKSTDFVAGKGNGLIMLLHGAPGTGKTFTAEGVAEFAEKPLLRVTCGDVGTDAEVVDQRLRATFQLGKMWDCVVLLDEADVFLEERDMKDLKRNALVSVFLRALEYYDGILILTSNRVGTFDEAFKSRIQLALHYDNLGLIQRKKIWRNFISRIRSLEVSSSADMEDILDHIDSLSAEVMNGREIRNAITIARQLAQFREEAFQYKHLKHAITVGGRFDKYLKDLRMGFGDDVIKMDSGIRLTYTAVPPPGLE